MSWVFCVVHQSVNDCVPACAADFSAIGSRRAVSRWIATTLSGSERVNRGRVADAVDRGDVAVLGRECRGPVRRRVRTRGVDGLDDRRQVLPLDLDELRRVLRLVAGLGDHHRVGVADEPRRVGGERIPRRGDDGRAVGPLVHLRERQLADAVGDEIRAGEHRDHAGRLARGGGVDPDDARVRILRARERAVRLVRQGHVVGELPPPGHEVPVLEATDRLADPLALSGLEVFGCGAHCLWIE
jgi:hypothetical protein